MYTPLYKLPASFGGILLHIDELRDKIQNAKILPTVEAEIHERASVESTYSSTSIEGNPLNIHEVRKAVKAPNLPCKDYAEIEVQNYYKALDFIEKRSSKSIYLTEEDILSLHRIITDSLLDDSRCGKWRHNPVHIVNPNNEIIYEAAPTKSVPSGIKKLLDWINTTGATLHPVIVAGVLHLQIAAIHPFADGNGRTARALSMLYLAMRGFGFRNAIVLDQYYAEDRRAYYDALQDAHGATYGASKERDITSWLIYFTEGVLSSAKVLDASIRVLKVSTSTNKSVLDQDEQDIISYIKEFNSVSVSEAESILVKTSRRSIQRKLKNLVDTGYLKASGTARNTIYTLGEKSA